MAERLRAIQADALKNAQKKRREQAAAVSERAEQAAISAAGQGKSSVMIQVTEEESGCTDEIDRAIQELLAGVKVCFSRDPRDYQNYVEISWS